MVFGHHGYLEEERRLGQRFLVDLWVDVRGDAAESDLIGDTVDYRQLAALVREVFAGQERLLLEGLAGAVADGIVERFPRRSSVRVSVCASPTSCSIHPSITRRWSSSARARDARVRGARREPRPREETLRRAVGYSGGRRRRGGRASRASRDGAGRRRRSAAVPERRGRGRDDAVTAEPCSTTCWRSSARSAGCATSAGGRASSTSTCSSTGTRWSTSRASGPASAPPRASVRARAARGARTRARGPGPGKCRRYSRR